MARTPRIRRFTVDLPEVGSLRYKNMMTNLYYDAALARHRRRSVTKHVSETPYNILWKARRNTKRVNKVLTGIRWVMRWNKHVALSKVKV